MNEVDKEYHGGQYGKPYRSTEVFIEWLERKGLLRKDIEQNICDMACGGGANIDYLSNKYEKSYFTGIDISTELIKWGNEKLRGKKNCKLYQGDWFALDEKWGGEI